MRRLWVVAFLAMVLTVTGCGGADTSDTPAEEAERTEGAEEVVASEPTAETTAGSARLEETYPERPDPSASLNFNCASFDTQEDAQARLDASSMAAEREVLDANGNGIACDEPGSDVGADARAEAYREAGPELSANDQAMIDLGNCQLAEARASMSPEEFAAFEQEITDELLTAIEQDIDTDAQTILAERGYTCGGRAEELLGR